MNTHKKALAALEPSHGKALPNYAEAEQSVIGAIINHSRMYDEVAFLRPQMFYNNRYEMLFELIVKMHGQQKPIDLITLTQEVFAAGYAEQIPPYFIAETSGAVISTAHTFEHALLIKQKYIQRQAIALTHTVQQSAYDEHEDIGDVLYHAGQEIENLQESLIGQDDIRSFAEVSTLALKDIDRKISLYNSGKQTGITTGLIALNRMTSGWQGGELTVIAARPAMGKTAVALHFAKSAAEQGTPVAFFSLEMSNTSLYNRILLSEASIDPEKLKSGNLNADDLAQVDCAARKLFDLPLYIADNASVNMSYIRSKCRLLHKKNRCGMVVIDYLQLAGESGNAYRSREQEITQMSREAKIIAKELDVPVLLLSQLNRKVEERADKRPMLSDLRESGSIEQDADMVMFIHRPEYYGIVPTNVVTGVEERNCGKLIIAKYRNGKTGEVKFTHNDSLTRVYDM